MPRVVAAALALLLAHAGCERAPAEHPVEAQADDATIAPALEETDSAAAHKHDDPFPALDIGPDDAIKIHAADPLIPRRDVTLAYLPDLGIYLHRRDRSDLAPGLILERCWLDAMNVRPEWSPLLRGEWANFEDERLRRFLLPGEMPVWLTDQDTNASCFYDGERIDAAVAALIARVLEQAHPVNRVTDLPAAARDALPEHCLHGLDP